MALQARVNLITPSIECEAGGTVSYSFDVENTTDSVVKVGIEPLGQNKRWIELTNPEHAELALPARGLQRVSVNITVPATEQANRHSFKVRVYDVRTPTLANESSAVKLDVRVPLSTVRGIAPVPPPVVKPSRPNWLPVISTMGVGGVVLVAALIGLLVWFTGGDTAVPDLVGKTADEATAQLEGDGFAPPLVTQEVTAEHEPGRVVRQTPEAGADKPENGVVSLIVAAAPPRNNFVENGQDLQIDPNVGSAGLIIADEITVSGVVQFPTETFWVANSIIFDDDAQVVAAAGVALRMAAARFVNLRASADGANAASRGDHGGNAGTVLLVGLDFDVGRVSAKGGNGAQGLNGTAGGNGRNGRCDGFGEYRGNQRGGDGAPGGAGGNGGSGGSVTVYSSTAVPEGSFNVEGGRAAIGGNGGPGGRGGSGCSGLGGTQAAAGNGNLGAQGPAGTDGTPGQVRPRRLDRSTIPDAVRAALDLRPQTAAEFETVLRLQLQRVE